MVTVKDLLEKAFQVQINNAKHLNPLSNISFFNQNDLNKGYPNALYAFGDNRIILLHL